MLAVARHDMFRLCFADDALKKDIQFIIALVACSGSAALNVASDDLKANRHVVFAAVSKESSALRFVRNEGLLGDREIILVSISGASSGTHISLTAYYHFTRNTLNYVLASLEKDV